MYFKEDDIADRVQVTSLAPAASIYWIEKQCLPADVSSTDVEGMFSSSSVFSWL